MRFVNKTSGAGAVAASALMLCAVWVPAATRKQKHPVVVGRSISFAKDVRPMLGKFCIKCHGGGSPAAGISFDSLTSEQTFVSKRDLWQRIAENLGSGHMPPEGMPHPTKLDRATISSWIQLRQVADCKLNDPGRVTMRRLNRMEYDNTVRDLTGLDLHLSVDFPSDDVGYGFDNVGDVLSLSPLLMEKYLAAAEKIAKVAIPIHEDKPIRFEAEKLKNTVSGNPAPDGSWILYSNGAMVATYDFPHAGSYRVRVKSYGQQAGPDPTKMMVKLDGQVLDQIDVKAVEAKPEVYEFPIRVDAGPHKISAAFMNDYYSPGPPPQDRNLVINWIEVASPAPTGPDIPESERRIITRPHDPTDLKAATEFLKAFCGRAFRRPATPVEVDRLTQIADLVMKDGEPFERAIQVGVQAILSSPNFLFRVEREDGSSRLGPYELANRLSYFLWSSMPDDELEATAATGEIMKPDVLKREAKRMLADPKAGALADGFAAQWLNLRKLAGINPDPQLFPDFSEKLKEDMLTETRMFFTGVVQNDRSVLDFLGAKYTYANERLAKHYGIVGVGGEEFRKISLDGTPRTGVLTQASVLTLTSNPTRTSPVKRGKWVLDELLNQPPPPPPPGVGTLKGDGHQLTGATLRARMEEHRKDPMCASCHMRMDPIGFSLENFDATGKWRMKDSGVKIDSSGVLPDGTKFQGPNELSGILLGRKDQFVNCLSEKILTYALGRGMEAADKCHVDQISANVRSHNYRFSSLVYATIGNDAFLMRRPTTKGNP